MIVRFLPWLDVYDVRGRMIRRLARGPREVGSHSVTWRLCGQSEHVSRGVYWLAVDRVVARKITLHD